MVVASFKVAVLSKHLPGKANKSRKAELDQSNSRPTGLGCYYIAMFLEPFVFRIEEIVLECGRLKAIHINS